MTLTRTVGGPTAVVRTGATGANGRINLSAVNGLVSSLTLTFDNGNCLPLSDGVEHGSLADARWQFDHPLVQLCGPALRLDHLPLLRRWNVVGTIDGATDFAQFGALFGQTLANSTFDYDANGPIDGPIDFAQFVGVFGTTI